MSKDIDFIFNDDDVFEKFVFDEISSQIDKKYLKCLEEKFGHKSFRKMQWKVISSVMNEKRDNCVVMATGYGKSLCFQFTSVFLNTVTVIVSPLISLMEDQVLSLTISNIKSCFLGSAQTKKNILDDVFNFEYNLVYVTPEFLTGEFGQTFLRKLMPKLSLIAIDEAHCISKWGHDFRSAYRNLGFIRSCVPNIPILAMTATATQQVQNDICQLLKLRNPQIVCTGYDRPNLEFHVLSKGNLGPWKDIGQLVKSVNRGSVIIYCLTRNTTEKLCEILQSNGIDSKVYHAGLTIKQRREVHENFVRDQLQVIVATIAFGMGIDKPDIRMVIHYGASKDIESYYQEVGRAGRDGMHSKCYMFFSNQDWRVHDLLTSKSTGGAEAKENRRNLSLKIREYCSLTTCRREFIIKYFEGANAQCPKQIKNCCDNCKNKSSTSVLGIEKLSYLYEELNDDGTCDFTNDAKNFFEALQAMNEWRGLATIIHFLRGNKRQNLGERNFSNPLFGIGKHRSEDFYKKFAELLEINGYIGRKSLNEKSRNSNFEIKKYQQFIYVITLTDKSREWLQMPEPKTKILLKVPKEMYKYFKMKRPVVKSVSSFNYNSNSTQNIGKSEMQNPIEELVTKFVKIRSQLASKLDVMPYMILSNKAIYQLAQLQPVNLEQFKASKLDGVSEVKAEKFGPFFIKCILESKNLHQQNSEISNEEKTIAELLEDNPLPGAKPFTSTLQETLELFRSGKSMQEIAQLRHLSESTISNYLNELIKLGHICERKYLYKLGISDSNFNIVSSIYKSFNDTKVTLKQIKEKCPPTITYDMIKFVQSYHNIRQHLIEHNIEFTDPDKKKLTNQNNQASTSKANSMQGNINMKNSDPALMQKSQKRNESISPENLIQSSENIVNNDNKDMLWESDDIFDDFDKIDNEISQANLSFTSEQSKECETIEDSFEENYNELAWAIEEMEAENSTIQEIPQVENNGFKPSKEIPETKKKLTNEIESDHHTIKLPPKRKINLKRKVFIYEDSSDDESN